MGCTGKATATPATGSTVASSSVESTSNQNNPGEDGSSPSPNQNSFNIGSGISPVLPSQKSNPSASPINSPSTSTTVSTIVSSANSARYSAILQLVVELRTHHISNDTIKQSITITDLNTLVTSLAAQPVKEAWESLALCLAGTCNDEKFLEFARTVVVDGSSHGMQNGPLALNLLIANKYWNTDNTIAFSEALSSAHSAIIILNKPDLAKSWQKFVECKGKCADKNQILFNLLKALS